MTGHHVSVHTLLCVIFALLTAASNASAAVLQRKAAAQVPPERALHFSLLANLLRRWVWLAGDRHLRADLEIPLLVARPRRWLPKPPDGTVTT